VDNYKLGFWVHKQRVAYRKGKLYNDQIETLEKLPGWVWNALKGQQRGKRHRTRSKGWIKSLERLREYVQREGNALVSYSYVTEDGYKLGTWVRDQRYEHKKGRLSPEQYTLLQQLPGWVWDARKYRHKDTSIAMKDRWIKGLENLSEYVKRKGHARVPCNYIAEDNYKLGAWVIRLRVLYKKGKLCAERQKALEKLTGWVWNARDARWPEAFNRLCKFVKREGHALVPAKYVTEDNHKLGAWVNKQRFAFRRRKLSNERKQALEQLPGWVWDARKSRLCLQNRWAL